MTVAEKVIVRQDSQYRLSVEAVDPQGEPDKFYPVGKLHDVTPFGMLLVSLGACTTILLHSYSRNHGLRLREAEVRLEYLDAEGEQPEHITAEVAVRGNLTGDEEQRLLQVSQHCAVHNLLENGIEKQGGRLEHAPSGSKEQV